MIIRNKKLLYLAVLSLIISFASCKKQLHLEPPDSTTATDVYSTPLGFKEAVAKMYGAYGVPGSGGPSASSGDIANIDQGTSDFIRQLFDMQELTTDEAVCAWGDAGVQDLHGMYWTAANPLINGLYQRCIFQIEICNEIIRHSSDAAVSSFSAADQAEVGHYKAEARFLRAYQYSVLMDLFGNPPFITEKDIPGNFLPPQKKRADLFLYVESELKAIDGELVAARQNEYGRADQAAAWALLARIYLNAQIYTGTANYTSAITYAQKVIGAGYSLRTGYPNLFLADNNLNNNEVILSINYDGVNTQNYGGTTFLVNSSYGSANGVNISTGAAEGLSSSGWGGNRATLPFAQLFGANYDSSADKRAIFQAPKPMMLDPTHFDQGVGVLKYKNLTSTGGKGATDGTFVSTDFPLFRLAEMYLIYAEATLRGGGGGSTATALEYINALRDRAYGNTSGEITSGTLTTDFILDERGRELYWECFRRSDLIRYGKFTTTNYLWPWKGNVASGRSVSDNFNLFPIPTSDISTNPNLIQNTGY